MVRRLVLPLALGALVALPALPTSEAEDLSSPPVVEMKTAANAFARDLYGRVNGGTGNLFFSPYSVHAAMLLAREGAKGETAAQMDKVLGLKGFDAGSGYRGLKGILLPRDVWDGHGKDRKKVPAYTLQIANAMWGQKGYDFEKPFLDRLAKTYAAPLARVDFGDAATARKTINDWVSKATREKIEDIVPEGMPPPLTRLVLANAIYLKAQWKDPFQARWTKEEDFNGPDGKKSKAKLMHRVGRFRYDEKEGVQILELPYRGGNLAMVVYLPKTHEGLKDVEDKLRKGKLDSELTHHRLVDVKLPRWKFTTSLDLTATLPTMGMPDAFHPSKADFSGMTKAEKLHIGVVLHKAFVAVDEDGTEAAAATVVMMKAASAPRPEDKKFFRADRPFVFEIRHRASGTILFSGRVTRP